MPETALLPLRLHHHAWTTRDMAATRAFYEDVLGLPLVATWSESDRLFGKVRSYVHCFFGLADGSALAFFQFADATDAEEFVPPPATTPFRHVALKVDRATQQALEQRLAAAGYTEPQSFVLDHGYCRSLYVCDPNELLVEFTLDAPGAERIASERRADARATLDRWLAGDHASNNFHRGNTV